jgi:hypothetical protein
MKDATSHSMQHVYADKKEVHVMSLKMAADSMKNDSMQK